MRKFSASGKSLVLDMFPERLATKSRSDFPFMEEAVFAEDFAKNPDFSRLILEIISCFSRIDATWGILFSVILGDSRLPAAHSYLAVKNQRSQREMLSAAAKTALHAEDVKVVELLLKIYEELYDYRNYFAHGMLSFERRRDGSQARYLGTSSMDWFVSVDSRELKKLSKDEIIAFRREQTNDLLLFSPEVLAHVNEAARWLFSMVYGCFDALDGVSDRKTLRKKAALDALSKEPRLQTAYTRSVSSKGGGKKPPP